jgi:hypothetical protein
VRAADVREHRLHHPKTPANFRFMATINSISLKPCGLDCRLMDVIEAFVEFS